MAAISRRCAEPRHTGWVSRGRLRIYLGVAAGVGTTYAMLDEALRRQNRGTLVVVGCVDTHGRAHTRERLVQLCDPARAPHELDVEAVLAQLPQVVLVDELAHHNPPGAARPSRWQDVEVLLDAGVDVISTLTVQHIGSLVDPVREIVGAVPSETVPDDFLMRARIRSSWSTSRRMPFGGESPTATCSARTN